METEWARLIGTDSVYAFRYKDVILTQRIVGSGAQRVDIILTNGTAINVYISEEQFNGFLVGMGAGVA